MPRGRRRGNNEGKVDRETFYQRGSRDYTEGRLPLLPEDASTTAHKDDYYEGYEVNQDSTSEYPGLGRWGRGN